MFEIFINMIYTRIKLNATYVLFSYLQSQEGHISDNSISVTKIANIY